MAITKIKAIRGTLNKAIEYITNPAKTDEKLLVYSYGCAAETAAKEFEWTRTIAVQRGMQPVKILARHVVQSFDIGEVSPEVAHEIGKQFADEILQGKYEYVLSTHVDKGHVHNHIIFNSVNFVDYHAYKSYRKFYYDMRKVSDRICSEHGLSVVPPSQNKGKGYKEHSEAKQGNSWKQKLKQTIDKCIVIAKDWEEFLRLMEEAGYEIKHGKFISFRAEGQERFTRAKTIGANYTEERIKERISRFNPRKRIHQNQKEQGVSLIIDLRNSIKAQQSKGYEHWAKMYNLQMMSETLNYLEEHQLTTEEELEQKFRDLQVKGVQNGQELKSIEAQIAQTQLLIKNVKNYQRTKPVYDEYVKASNKPEFKRLHESELIIFEAAKKIIEESNISLENLSLSALQLSLSEAEKIQKDLYNERKKIKSDEDQLKAIRGNVDAILDARLSVPENQIEK